ncbi:MAG TPA: hypothetical protein VFC46_10640 [Humisphaera sp.]|nr:hypothetical protein [Humisphaera sp.]
MTYAVFDEGNTLHGDAEEILERIRAEAAENNDEVKSMTTADYADALIEDAPYMLPGELFDAFNREDFPSRYDRALAYLSAYPTSGIRILSAR